jgi:hypothetical protein
VPLYCADVWGNRWAALDWHDGKAWRIWSEVKAAGHFVSEFSPVLMPDGSILAAARMQVRAKEYTPEWVDLFKSTNGGMTWARIEKRLPMNAQKMALVGDTLYLGGRGCGGICLCESADGGEWTCGPLRQFSGDGVAARLLPPALGLAVVHEEVAETQPPGRAEVQHATVQRALEGDGRIAQRTEGDRQRQPAHRVVDDLVPGQDLQGIGADVVAHLHQHHRLLRLQPLVSLGGGHELGRVYGRDAILGRPAGENLAVGDRMAAEVGAELTLGAGRRRFRRQQLAGSL